MEEIAEFAAENAEKLLYGGAGFALGAFGAYTVKYQDQRAGREPFPDEDPRQEWREKILEEDPLYEEDMHDENALMELYYDNFDAVKRNYRDARASVISTFFLDAVDEFGPGNDMLGLDQYPETAAGFFTGLKIGKKAPTPVDLSEAYQSIVSDGESSK